MDVIFICWQKWRLLDKTIKVISNFVHRRNVSVQNPPGFWTDTTKHNIFAIITKIGFAYSTPLPPNHEGFLFVTFSFIIVLWIFCKNIDKIIHCGDPSFDGAMYFCHHCEVNIWSLFLFVATAISVLLAAISILWNTLPPCASSSSNTFCMIVLSFSCNLLSHHILHFSGAFEQVTSVRVFSQPMPSPPVSNSASAFACAT